MQRKQISSINNAVLGLKAKERNKVGARVKHFFQETVLTFKVQKLSFRKKLRMVRRVLVCVILLLDTKLNEAEAINVQVDRNNSNSILNMVNKQLNIFFKRRYLHPRSRNSVSEKTTHGQGDCWCVLFCSQIQN